MMNTTFDSIAVSLPIAIFLFLGKEWFVANAANTLGLIPDWRYKKSYEILERVDIWAFAVFALWGVSWGGVVRSNKRSTIFIFIASQLWFLLVMLGCLLYYKLKNPEIGGYIDVYTRAIISGAWTLHLMNYLPIPPFDASFFYLKGNMALKVNIIAKILFAGAAMAGVFNNDFITGTQFMNWFFTE